MDEIDAQIEAARAELAALRAEPKPSMLGQFAFDVPVGVARAGAGLADVLAYPVVKGLEYAGAPVETFGLSKLLTEAAGAETPTQEVVSFLTPSPLSKARLLSQAGTGLASYLGMKGAEAVAPESQYAGLVGALAGPGLATGAGRLAGAAAPALEEAGLGLQRRALGLTKADYKNAKNAVIETVSGDFSTQLKESVDDLIKNKTLGTSLDPGAMFAELQGAKSATEDAIQATLKAAETKIGPVPPPNFDKTIDYISKNIAADQVDKYVNNVIEFQDALRREGQGSLTYLNQQKKIIGENWKNSPQSDPGFWRTIYGDVKRHIEKYAPEVKDLNKEKQKLILAEPVVTRNFKASGGDYDIGALQRLLNTTGGAGLAGGAILGAATGSLTGGVAGALALRGLATPTGQNIVGRGLRGTASLAEALGGAGLDVGGALQRGGIAAGDTEPTQILSTNTERPQYANGSELAKALKAQVDKVPMLSENSPSYVDDLKYDLNALDTLYKQSNLGSLIINKTKGTETFVPGFNAEIPKGIIGPDDDIEIKNNVQKIGATEAPVDIDAAIEAARRELKALRGTATEPTPQPEAVSRSKEKGKGIPTKEVSALLDEVPREYGINPKWVKAIAQVESSFNPKAVGPNTRFGQAQGLMQLMPATAKALKVKNPFDPKQAIEGASKLLVELDDAYGKYKDKRLLFAAYNSRPSKVNAAIRQAKAAGKDITWENIAKYMPNETQNYVNEVTKLIEA